MERNRHLHRALSLGRCQTAQPVQVWAMFEVVHLGEQGTSNKDIMHNQNLK